MLHYISKYYYYTRTFTSLWHKVQIQYFVSIAINSGAARVYSRQGINWMPIRVVGMFDTNKHVSILLLTNIQNLIQGGILLCFNIGMKNTDVVHTDIVLAVCYLPWKYSSRCERSCRFCGRKKAAIRISPKAKLQMNRLVTVCIFLFRFPTIMTPILLSSVTFLSMYLLPSNSSCCPNQEISSLTYLKYNHKKASLCPTVTVQLCFLSQFCLSCILIACVLPIPSCIYQPFE